MKEPNGHTSFKRALEKSLDVLGEPSKRSLLICLEKDFHISFRQRDSTSINDVEGALKSILGTGAYIVTDKFHNNLESAACKAAKKAATDKQARRLGSR